MTEYCFVLDSNGKQLSPTKVNKGWYLIRKSRAELVSKYPMIIQLKKEINPDEEDESQYVCGIDDGSKHVGIAIVQQCKNKNKIVFKGQIELRQDVKHLMDVRRGYRKYRRQHKKYRPVRFNNRSSSMREGRIAPSIKQKKDSVLRVINKLNKWCSVDKIVLEDVTIDIRALTEGKKLYRWQYQKSNRLDENLRKAVIIRDGNKCMECGKINCMLEVHHIIPRRLRGSDTISNLITLCSDCHDKTEGKEELFIEKYQKMIGGKNVRFDYAQHVMQGKSYMRSELSKITELELTTGGDTANKRIDWDIEKSHSNDAVVICGLKVGEVNVKEWIIKLMRRKSKAKVDEADGFRHRDLIEYKKKNGEKYIGWVTAMYPEKKQCNLTTLDGKVLKRYGVKSCRLLWRFNKIYWL